MVLLSQDGGPSGPHDGYDGDDGGDVPPVEYPPYDHEVWHPVYVCRRTLCMYVGVQTLAASARTLTTPGAS